MKAYPTAHIKIGGYTDNSGDASSNLGLSQQRAESVMQQLTTLGIAPDRMEAKGYGEQHPIADNSTEEGRARNRRVAVQVTQK
jgi:outer membrane protein OmpA-like peptidoglycan-associated protein